MSNCFKSIALFTLPVLLFIGCDRKNNPSPDHGSIAIFETIWNDFDRNYPYFLHKNIDWDSIYQSYYTQVNDNTSSADLFELIGKMTLTLEDIHVDVSSSFGVVQYSKKENYPKNSPDNANRYLSAVYLDNSKAVYGNIENTNFSYLRVKTFIGSTAAYLTAINSLDSLEQKDGLIIDIRDNGGGNELNGRAFAGRFCSEETVYRYTRVRDGIEWGTFTKWHSSYFLPNNPLSYNNKIILLTNRRVYSSAELFVLMMKTYPNLIIVGDTTGGASANPSQKSLPNGWKYRISTWQAAALDFELIEDNGIAPNHYILNDEQSVQEGKDLILEKAIELLSSIAE